MSFKNQKILTTQISQTINLSKYFGGCSSAGRALRWQRRGRRFDPDQLHQRRPERNSEHLDAKRERDRRAPPASEDFVGGLHRPQAAH